MSLSKRRDGMTVIPPALAQESGYTRLSWEQVKALLAFGNDLDRTTRGVIEGEVAWAREFPNQPQPLTFWRDEEGELCVSISPELSREVRRELGIALRELKG